MLRISANYKNLESYTVHGTAIGTDTSFQLDEISIVADPKTLKALGAFFMNAADEMEQHGLEHLHFQDLVENFCHDNHVDVIVLNSDAVIQELPSDGPLKSTDPTHFTTPTNSRRGPSARLYQCDRLGTVQEPTNSNDETEGRTGENR